MQLNRIVVMMALGTTALASLPVACGGMTAHEASNPCPPGYVCVPYDAAAEATSDTMADAQADGGRAQVDAASDATDAPADSSADGEADVLEDASPFDTGADSSIDSGTSSGSNCTGGSDAAGLGPEILSLSETALSVTQGGSFTVLAIVTDPGCLSNLAGGELTSESGAALGAFVPTTPGTYSLTVSWDQLNTAAAIDFTGHTTLTNRATFYDAQGLQTSQDISIELYCGSAAAPDAACAGQCVNLTSVGNCGSCTANCAGAGGLGAQDVACEAPGVCAWETTTSYATPNDTCTSECANGGGTCVAAQETPLYGTTAISEICSYSPTSSGGTIEVTAVVIAIECICSPGGAAYSKTQTGNCATMCTSLYGSPPCASTRVEVMGSDGLNYLFDDTCGAPYVYGFGTIWDGLAWADLPASEPVMSPVTIDCQCEGSAP